LGCGFVGMWYGPNMTHMQKRFIKLGLVGLWFDSNLRKVEIEPSMSSIGRRAGLLVCGLVVWSKYDERATKFYKTWFCGLVVWFRSERGRNGTLNV
jgi:hypothetical protein